MLLCWLYKRELKLELVWGNLKHKKDFYLFLCSKKIRHAAFLREAADSEVLMSSESQKKHLLPQAAHLPALFSMAAQILNPSI